MFKVDFISMPVLDNLYRLNGSKVHSIFKNVVNFEYCSKLISIQNSKIPKGPLSISIKETINFLDIPIKIEDVITIKKDVIYIGSISVNIERPLIWNPLLEEYSLLLCNNKKHTNKIKSLVILNGKSGGIKEEVLSIITGDSYKTYNDKNKLNVVKVLEEVYFDFYNKNQIDAAIKLSSLIGYGAGLTPAGDDFLVGVMSILHHCRLSKGISEFYEKLCSEILKNSHKTTMVSKTFLEEGTCARFSESFHKLYEAMWSVNSDELYKAVISMMSIGHSSGTDGICGVLWGLYLVSDLNINTNGG